LIGMSQDGLASFEPAFADELAVLMKWGFEHMQKEDGSSVSLRLTTNPLEQPKRDMNYQLEQDIISGGYWWRKPGPNCELVIAYQGAVAEQAIKAAGQLAELRKDIAVLGVTSSDRLYSGFMESQHARHQPDNLARTSHIERLLADVPKHATILSVIDGHPATLSWLGGVYGHQLFSHGVSFFGQTGTVDDLYRHYKIDQESLVQSVLDKTAGQPDIRRHLSAV